MKSERRHELQRNVLAEGLEATWERIQPYTNVALAILVLAALLVAVVVYWRKSEASERSRAWEEVYTSLGAEDPRGLEAVAEEGRGEEVGQWAAVLAGDMHLATGCNDLFSNRPTAIQELQKAQENYLSVLERASNSSIRERATFGLARTYEALAGTRQSQGELPKAVEQYRKLVQEWPDGVYRQVAERCLQNLEKPSTKAFYDWFAMNEPKPAAPLGAGNFPFDTGALGPGQQMPDLSQILGSGGSDAQTPAAQGQTPAQTETPPPAPEPAAASAAQPTQPEPAKSEPAKSEPAKPEAAKSEATKPETSNSAASKPAAPAEPKPAETTSAAPAKPKDGK